jgi:hypothetical protein
VRKEEYGDDKMHHLFLTLNINSHLNLSIDLPGTNINCIVAAFSLKSECQMVPKSLEKILCYPNKVAWKKR